MSDDVWTGAFETTVFARSTLEALERGTEQPVQGRQSEIQRARKVVLDELELNTLGRDITPALGDALKKTWVPAMSVVLARRGVNSKPWCYGIDLLQQLLDIADPPEAEARRPDRAEVVARLGRLMTKLGMPESSTGRLLDELKQALSNPLAQAMAGVSPELSDPETLNRLLRNVLNQDTWFEFKDGGELRWLKPQGFSAEARIVNFAEYDGRPGLTLSVSGFLDRLAQGQARAVNPTPRAEILLDELVAYRYATAGA